MKPTVLFEKNARNIFFHILTQCNLSCSHCYINPELHGKNMLPFITIENWLHLFYNDQPSHIIFLGGEPTLHPDLHECIVTAKEIGYESITIDTNGYLFHDILYRVTPQDVDYFSFSLDGPTAAINDSIRGQGSFDACISGIKHAVAQGFSVSLIYTVSRLNMHAIHHMPALLSDLGINRFFIQTIGLRGNSANDLSLQLTFDEWQCIISDMCDLLSGTGIQTTYPKVFLKHDEPFECAGLVSHNYFIFPNGRVFQCPLCEDYPLNSLRIMNDKLIPEPKINEKDLFQLTIPEGCVMNRLIQPGNISYDSKKQPKYRIACCMLKETII